MIPLHDVFDAFYGSNLELNALTRDEHGINFVSRTEKNNGVSAKVKRIEAIDPIKGGTISVACGGSSVMESCLQLSPYYSGRDVIYLVSKENMSNEVKLFYCACLKANRFKYSFGRQANATLRHLLIPSAEEIPAWVSAFSVKDYAKKLLNLIISENAAETVPHSEATGSLASLSTLFTPIGGVASSTLKRWTQRPDDSSYVPFIRPSFRQSTSVDAYVSRNSVSPDHIFPKGTLYVSTDGQGSHTYAYVSAFEFVPNSNVSVLIPKRGMGLQEKLYYAECITSNRFKFSYGRKPKGDRLKAIMLPEHPPATITQSGTAQTIADFLGIVDKL
jgi:hypothetical protein